MGGAAYSNGKILALADQQFDVFIRRQEQSISTELPAYKWRCRYWQPIEFQCGHRLSHSPPPLPKIAGVLNTFNRRIDRDGKLGIRTILSLSTFAAS